MPLKLCLFFTYDISLKKWDELGILDREVLLYRNLVDKGVEVAFFTYGDKGDLSYKERLFGIRVIPAYSYVTKPKNNKIAFLDSLLFPIKFKRVFSSYDIFKTNQIWGAWVPLIARLLLRKKLLVRCGYEHYYTILAEKRPNMEKIIFYLFSRIVYSSADRIVVTTKKIAGFITERFFVSGEKISVLPNSVDTQLFKIKEHSAQFLDRVLFVGRLSKQKNLFSLIEACSKASVGLDLIGEGELRPEIEKLIQKKNADVRLLGVHPNNQLPDIFSKYRFFVLSSFFEGNPKALIEAMSCGKAVIGTDVDGIHELIKNEDNGVLCGISSDKIADAILKVKNDIGLQKRMGEKAREYVLKNYSIDKIVNREFDLYRSVLKS